MKKRLIRLISGTVCAMSLFATTPAFAKSATRSTSAPGGTLTSNFWIQSMADSSSTGSYQVSAVYNGTASLKGSNYIKTAWDFYATGISAGVSAGGGTGSVSGSGASGTSGGSWKNNNGATTAWYKGTVRATGLAIYVGGNNTASMFALGVPASVTTGV